jgi:signal transduction histidine kinase
MRIISDRSSSLAWRRPELPWTRKRQARRGSRCLLLAFFVLTLCAHVAAAAPAVQHKRVLAIYSLRRDAAFSVLGEHELPQTLGDALAQKLDYYSEFIDVARFPDPSYRMLFEDFIRRKYQDVRFDLVIAIQDMAVEFVRGERDGLFRDTPVVFLALNPSIARPPNSAGLIHGRDFAGTVTLIQHLQPDVRNIFVVTGAAPADAEYEALVRTQLRVFEHRVKIIYLSGLKTADLTTRLSKLPPHSAVYYVLVNEDGAGERFHPLEYADVVSDAANAPTYCWTDSCIGHGIVGGNLYLQKAVFDGLGELALRVLRGERADSIPTATLNLNKDEVDARQLRRWHIPESRVPATATLDFPEPGLWARYKAYILVGLGVLILQSVLITGLLLQSRRRRLAEGQLRGSQRELIKSYERNRDLGARLLKAQETERSRIAGELHDDICQRMLLLTMELESLRRANRDEGPAAEALTVAQGISRSLHELSHRLHPTRLRLIGLVSAVDQLSRELSRAGIVISFAHDQVPPALPADVMLCLFRTVQEALQNAIKYSRARELSVQLSGGPDGLTLTVVDDGIGFDVESAWSKGLGLASMSERLETIGGSLDIQSAPGGGTRLTATVPQHVLHAADETVAV